MARGLLDERGVDATLDRICSLAVETVEGQAAGISIAEGKRVTSRSTTDELPSVLDQIQTQTQEGPSVDAIKEHEMFMTGSLADENRWPEFAHRAHELTGVKSILSLRLFASEDTMGSLNLYSMAPDAFDDDDIAVGSVFAAHAAVALAGATWEAQLEAKADTRRHHRYGQGDDHGPAGGFRRRGVRHPSSLSAGERRATEDRRAGLADE